MSLCLPYKEKKSSSPFLLILLHGKGANETDLFDLAPFFCDQFTILSPRAFLAYETGFAWFESQRNTDKTLLINAPSAVNAQKIVSQFTQEAQCEYGIPPQQTFIAGFSQGAMLAISLSNLVKGAIGWSGQYIPELFLQEQKKSPILLTHGIFDPIIGIQTAQESYQKIKTIHPDTHYQEYSVEHDLSLDCVRDTKKWLTQKAGI
jgi:phospholipase/carboxylesterase